MAKAAFTGYVSFEGLFRFGVSAYKATEPSNGGISFKGICPTCKTPTSQPVKCTKCNAEVDRKNLLKGYEYEKGKFAVFTQQELEVLDKESNKLNEVLSMIEGDVDPLYIESTFYLAPESFVAAEPFAIIREAMRQMSLTAIGKMTVYGRDRMTAIAPAGKGMILHLLRLDENIRSIEDIDKLKDVSEKVPDAPLALAKQLLEGLTHEDFDMTELKDTRTQLAMDMIRARAKEEPLPEVTPKEEPEKVVNIMAALQVAVAKVEGKRKAAKSSKVTVKPVKIVKSKASKKKAA